MKYTHSLYGILFCFLFMQFAAVDKAAAQTDKKIKYYLNVGAGIPAAPSNFTTNWNIGYGIGAGVSYEIRPSVDLQLLWQYHRFGFDEDGARNGVDVPQAIIGIDGAEAEIFTGMLNVIYDYTLPGVPTSTYVSIGAGFFHSALSDFTVATANDSFFFNQRSKSTAGVNGALGIRHSLSDNTSLYAEAKFVTSLFVNRRNQYFPISVGVIF
jgi:opacity protein-like surface antigen